MAYGGSGGIGGIGGDGGGGEGDGGDNTHARTHALAVRSRVTRWGARALSILQLREVDYFVRGD